MSSEEEPFEIRPSRRERVKPLEIVGFSGVLALFTALVVVFVTDDFILALIFAGIAFIVALMIFALLALSIRPRSPEEDTRAQTLNSPPEGSGH